MNVLTSQPSTKNPKSKADASFLFCPSSHVEPIIRSNQLCVHICIVLSLYPPPWARPPSSSSWPLPSLHHWSLSLLPCNTFSVPVSNFKYKSPTYMPPVASLHVLLTQVKTQGDTDHGLSFYMHLIPCFPPTFFFFFAFVLKHSISVSQPQTFAVVGASARNLLPSQSQWLLHLKCYLLKKAVIRPPNLSSQPITLCHVTEF